MKKLNFKLHGEQGGSLKADDNTGNGYIITNAVNSSFNLAHFTNSVLDDEVENHKTLYEALDSANLRYNREGK